MTPPEEVELDEILTKLRAGKDPDTQQPHITWNEARTALVRWREAYADKAYSSGYDDCLREHGAVFKNSALRKVNKEEAK